MLNFLNKLVGDCTFTNAKTDPNLNTNPNPNPNLNPNPHPNPNQAYQP